jgi:hypothetical protein
MYIFSEHWQTSGKPTLVYQKPLEQTVFVAQNYTKNTLNALVKLCVFGSHII